jgi:hypothetical protein
MVEGSRLRPVQSQETCLLLFIWGDLYNRKSGNVLKMTPYPKCGG